MVALDDGWIKFFSLLPEPFLLLEMRPHPSPVSSIKFESIQSFHQASASRVPPPSDAQTTSNRLLAIYDVENVVLQIDCLDLYEALLSQLRASSSNNNENLNSYTESLALSPQEASRNIGLHKWSVRSGSSHHHSSIINVLLLSSQVMDVATCAASLPTSDAALKWVLSGSGSPSQGDPKSLFGGRWRNKDSRYIPSQIAIDSDLQVWQQWRQWQSHLAATKHLEMMVINSEQPMVSFFSIAVEPPSFLHSAASALASNVAIKAQKITSSIYSFAKSWWSAPGPALEEPQPPVCTTTTFFFFFFIF